jgi:hypothetical protein
LALEAPLGLYFGKQFMHTESLKPCFTKQKIPLFLFDFSTLTSN